MENSNDPFLPLAIAAMETDAIELMTGIAISFNRSPMVAANMSHDLHLASGGRFKLGLGSQVKGHNVRRFSVPWTPPLRSLFQNFSSADGSMFHPGESAIHSG